MSEAEAPPRRERTTGMTFFYVLLAALGLAGLGAVGYTVIAGRSGVPALSPLDLEGLDDPEALVAMARGSTKGDPNAPIMIVEFGDYQCPACGQFARDFKPGVELAFVETGRARFVFHDYPLVGMHPHAFLAARAARCAEDQGKFWEYHDELYRLQVRWSPEPNPVGMFEGYAEGLGLDVGDFRSCLNSDRHADLVTANLRLAEELGIPQTPTILVNAGGVTHEARGWSAEEIQATIDAMTAPAPN
jgi:protein-disulfide isomerase